MKRLAIASAAALALLLPAAAAAHVSLHPNEIPAGAFATVDVRVPGEEQGAYAWKVVMQMPPGFTDVALANVPGWTATTTLTTLKKPLSTPDGPVDQVVSKITWTGDRSKLGRIDDGHFQQFPIDITIPAHLAGRALTFRTVEFYKGAPNAYWIGAPTATFPAPTIDITKAGGVIQDVASTEAGPSPNQSTPSEPAEGSTDTLGIVAIVLSALALLTVAAGAARRRAKT